MYPTDTFSSFTDAELVSLMQSGHEKAFAAIYDRYWERLYADAGKRLGNIMATQDIVQDIMESIWIKRQTLTTQNGSLAPYLFTILKYRIIDTLAHTRKQEVCYHAFGQLLALQEQRILEGLISKELQAHIDHEISAMADNMQKVIRLSREEGNSVAEIARLLSLSEQTVRNLLSQAVKRLRICVEQFYSDQPSQAPPAFMAAAIVFLGL
ncbi:RNA polymerase sigma factor [Chitinophaga sp. XS-30]|uniref:RNA polymerase sigma factor n=1 Tax=Chitinophaga sp. XS-30 TaxID=2604421 RepID=UPI0011DCCB34|nr:sigma-70 family RNA polymerase sigma factor [Chitinophaga sp. XS-30]QEH39401.1 sigma-70 family RNA polymerase sigma factor [Chitinophaga sp. XS-30]